MGIGWQDIAFIPSDEFAQDIVAAWEWLVGYPGWAPFLCSKLGDVFYERPDGKIDWLSCSAGMIEHAASDRRSFDEKCRDGGEQVDEWFGPGLIATLHEVGKIAGDGQCYLFITLPIFAECTYTHDNLGVVSLNEVFVGLSEVHQQIAEMPDGTKIRLKVVD